VAACVDIFHSTDFASCGEPGQVPCADGSLADSAPRSDAARDAAKDAARDATRDAAGDAPHADGTVVDARHDSPGHPDDAADAGIPDSSKVDAPLDARSPHDAGVDAPTLHLAEYLGAVENAFCGRLAACCDAGAPFVASCVSAVAPNGKNPGGVIANLGTLVVDGGHVTFDASAAMACLSAIGDIAPCDTLSADQHLAITKACAAPIKGTLTIGATGCRSSWDCVQPAYCDGTGACRSLHPSDAACGDRVLSQDCSSLGNTPGTFCATVTAGMDGGTCLAAAPDGGACTAGDVSCQSFLCSDDGKTCVSASPFASTGSGGVCLAFAGDGG
jgi:hypothetical protein